MKFPYFLWGGWIYHLIFICENNRKSHKIMNCVDFFLSGSMEDMGIFHVFIYISVMGWYNPTHPLHQN